MQPFNQLLSATEAATRFLHRYVKDGRGYTTQDVQAAIQRLESLYRELEQVEKPSWQQAQAAVMILDAAEQCMEQARDRLSNIEPD